MDSLMARLKKLPMLCDNCRSSDACLRRLNPDSIDTCAWHPLTRAVRLERRDTRTAGDPNPTLTVENLMRLKGYV